MTLMSTGRHPAHHRSVATMSGTQLRSDYPDVFNTPLNIAEHDRARHFTMAMSFDREVRTIERERTLCLKENQVNVRQMHKRSAKIQRHKALVGRQVFAEDPPGSEVSVSSVHYDDVIITTKASQITSLTVVYSIVYSAVDQRKHQSSASLAFVRGIPRTKGQLRGKCFHLMTSSWRYILSISRMTSWHGNVFRITGPLWGESIGHQCIPLASGQ